MNRKESPSDLELRALLERAKVVPRLPAAVRARALDRARMAAATSNQLPLESFPTSPARSPLARLAPALPIAVAIAAAGAFAMWRTQPSHAPAEPTQASSAHVITAVEPASPLAAASASAVAPEAPKVEPVRSNHPATIQESYAAELSLLRRAQSAFAAGNFANTLTLAAEHARRFPNGRLAEEREALRVRSLARSGRAEEARRAAAAFATRFPRSVLLPRIQKIGGIAKD